MFRLAVAAVLLILFTGYSGYVYTTGTDFHSGKNFSKSQISIGKILYQEKNCTACHQIYGLGGYLGPDLTNVISQKGKGEEYVRAILRTGTGRMPDYGFSEEEINALTAFLIDVNETTDRK
jgi:nitric oxide reductase subunit C